MYSSPNLKTLLRNSTPVAAPESACRSGLMHALFQDTSHALFEDAPFDDYAAEYSPFPNQFFVAERIVHQPPAAVRKSATLNWAITFFVLAVVFAVGGFGGLVGGLAAHAKAVSALFVVLFAASLLYGMVSGRKPVSPVISGGRPVLKARLLPGGWPQQSCHSEGA